MPSVLALPFMVKLNKMHHVCNIVYMIIHYRGVRVVLVIIISGQWDGLHQLTSLLILKMAFTFSSLMEMTEGVVFD